MKLRRSWQFAVTVGMLASAPSTLFSTPQGQPAENIESRVDRLLASMTLAEKIDYIGGFEAFNIRPMPRLGLPKITMADGPLGVRNYGKATAFPAPLLFAASWNPELMRAYGVAVGHEARAKGVHVLLAPGVNIHRSPLCSRNFEYLGEDPHLGSRMAVSYVQGVQSQGVVATVKHFAANNQEYDRNRVSSDLDERTLREIYLPIFRAAITEGRAGAVMTAYNPVNGQHCSENAHLIRDILKGQWQFDGVVMSDWGGTYDGVAAALAGLDLEMPRADAMNRATLLPAIQSGRIATSVIDDKVRRILRLIVRNGFMDRPQIDATIPRFNPESRAVALDAAREGIVLLKNRDDLLPFDPSRVRTIAVIGPNAHPAVIGGGGSSAMEPFRATSVLDGLLHEAPPGVRVLYEAGLTPAAGAPASSDVVLPAGFRGEYFDNRYLEGAPMFVREDREIRFDWTDAPAPKLPAQYFSVRWTGVIRARATGFYHLTVSADNAFRLYLDESLMIDNDDDQIVSRTKSVCLVAGEDYHLKLEYRHRRGPAHVALDLTEPWFRVSESATAFARSADAVVVCVGFNADSETEGQDRTFELPPGHAELIQEVAAANPNTVVVLNAGGNVAMTGWLDRIAGLLHTWYPGQEGGTALAEILFGRVVPSGKLPVSFEKRSEDNPTFPSYHDTGGGKRVAYREGVFLGYRHYDRIGSEPQFHFGFGLSYTRFEYQDLRLSTETIRDGEQLTISCSVRNAGQRRAAEVVELYIGAPDGKVERPVKELRGFHKVWLNPGEKQNVTFEVNAEVLAHFDPTVNAWVSSPGTYRVMIGSSSRDLRLEDSFHLKQGARGR